MLGKNQIKFNQDVGLEVGRWQVEKLRSEKVEDNGDIPKVRFFILSTLDWEGLIAIPNASLITSQRKGREAFFRLFGRDIIFG